MNRLIDQNNLVKRMAISTRLFALLGIILLIFTGCSTVLDTTQIPVADTSETSHIITVVPQTGDSSESLAKEYGGKVLAFKAGELALIGISVDNNANLSTQLLSKLTLTDGDVEENTNSFSINSEAGVDSSSSSVWSGGSSSVWSGGSSSVWSGGSSSVWSGGSSSVWSGGLFSWMPENTNIWNQIGLESGHNQSQNLGAGTIIAVIDTGVDYTHPALSQAVIPGWDFYDNDNDPFDEGTMFQDRGTGHGTHIAGVIRQVAPRATILPIRILGPDGTGSIADLATAILWAEEQGADIINLSLGSSSYSSAVNAALNSVTSKGVIVVAAAGNSGSKNVTYPASLMKLKALQVSVTSVDNNDIKSSFANYSYGIDMSAPGEQVYGPAPGNIKVAWSGTSMAAPIVVGALALGEADSSVSNKTLTRILSNSTYNIKDLSGNSSFSGWLGSQLGSGRLDVNSFFQDLGSNDAAISDSSNEDTSDDSDEVDDD